MATIRSTSDGGSQSIPRLVALVAVLTLVALALASGTVAADEHVEIDREDDKIDINGLEQNENVTVALEERDGTEREISEDTRLDIVELVGDVDESLENERVIVNDEDGNEVGNETLDLRVFALASPDELPAWIGDDTLYLPLDRSESVGVDGDGSVELDITRAESDSDESGETEPVDGISIATDGGPLTPEVDDVIADATPATNLTVDVVNGTTSLTPAGELTIEPEIRTIGDEFVLWHPTLEDGKTYEVAAGGTDELSVETNDGTLTLPSEGVDRGAETVSVSLERGNDVYLEERSVPVRDSFELNATIDDDGNIVFEEGVNGLMVDNATTFGGSVESISFTDEMVSNGVLTLDDATVTEDHELLLGTNAGVATLSLTEEPAPDEPSPLGQIIANVPLIFVGVFPVLVGVSLGVILGRRSLDREDYIGSIVIVTFSATAAFVSVLGLILLEIDELTLSMTDPLLITMVVSVLAAAGLGLVVQNITASRTLGGSEPSNIPTFRATVSVTDGSRELAGAKVSYWKSNEDRSRARTKQTNHQGTGTIQLDSGSTYKLQAKHNGRTSSVQTVSEGQSSASLIVTSESRLRVIDRTDNTPIPGASIQRSDASVTGKTGDRGAVKTKPPEQGTSVEVTAEHEKFESRTAVLDFTKEDSKTIRLPPKSGTLQLISKVDGVSVPGLQLSIEPEESFLKKWEGSKRPRSNQNGKAIESGLLVGSYTVSIGVPGDRSDLFGCDSTSVTVHEGQTTTAEVDVRFTWSLSQKQRHRLEKLRGEVEGLSAASGRDTTIPRYYGSVASVLLETVDSLPEQGHLFASNDGDPDEVADALLLAAENTIDTINDAMTTKRNIDLFAACADMPDARVEWDGECNLETLLSRLDMAPSEARKELRKRYETVSDTVETERREVSEIAPAQEMLQQARRIAGDARRGPEGMATVYAATLLLDAVEQLFEHDELRERLSRTVF